MSIAPPPESRHRAIKLAIQVGENGERLGSVSGRRGCGMELANHRTVTTNTGLDVYFCDPHSSWQRGTNENTNGLLGRYRAKPGGSTRHEARVFLDRKWVVLVAVHAKLVETDPIFSGDVKLLQRRGFSLDRPTIGTWLTLTDPAVAEIMAAAGFEWLVVDLEHSLLTLETAGELIRVIELCGASPLVRLTSNDSDQIKRVMDGGAHGIIVPMVLSADEAAKAVAATSYPPAGTRGVGLGRAQRYGVGFEEYLSWQVDGPIVIVQIEHRDSVANLEEILAVPGIGGFIIGPYDLSASMGIPGQFDDPGFLECMETIRSTARRMGVPSGIHIVEPDVAELEQAVADGYSLIAYGVDFRFLDVSARRGVVAMRELLS